MGEVRNTYTGILEAEAQCRDCDTEYTSRNALGLGNQHARRTGHEVCCTQTIVVTYNRKAK